LVRSYDFWKNAEIGKRQKHAPLGSMILNKSARPEIETRPKITQSMLSP
jgi:hypothetical protein